ncbi:MAG: hypothetical protein HY049_13480 [Acidobacteria bacterium]|nr:hypothetical protein [Acidobacteriota bacterium]
MAARPPVQPRLRRARVVRHGHHALPLERRRQLLAARRAPRLRLAQEQVTGRERDDVVTTLFNRRRYFPEMKSSDRMLIQQAPRAAVNSTIQGTAADIIKRATIDVDAAPRPPRPRSSA